MTLLKKTEKQIRSWLKIKAEGFAHRVNHPNAYGSMKRLPTLSADLKEITRVLDAEVKNMRK